MRIFALLIKKAKAMTNNEKHQDIKSDIENLKSANLPISILLDELKDDPDAYSYTIDDLEKYLSENPF